MENANEKVSESNGIATDNTAAFSRTFYNHGSRLAFAFAGFNQSHLLGH